jgi:hypothetical protein
VSLENGKLTVRGLRRQEPTGIALVAEFGEVEYGRVFAVPHARSVRNPGNGDEDENL